VASSASTTVLSDAALRPARWRASSCRPKLGGALKTSQPPPRPRPSAAPCWPIRRRSWSREHGVSCGERMRDPSGPRARASASNAALRSTRRASATFKRGASQAPSRGDDAGTFRSHPPRKRPRRRPPILPVRRCPPRCWTPRASTSPRGSRTTRQHGGRWRWRWLVFVAAHEHVLFSQAETRFSALFCTFRSLILLPEVRRCKIV